DDLLDLLKKSGRSVGEQQMGLVEKEHEARLFRIAHFGKILEQLRQEPQQEGRIELRRCHELVGSENIDKPAPVLRRAHYVLDVKRRFTEEIGGTLLVEHDKPTLYGANGDGSDVAVIGADLLAASGKIGKKRAEVLQIEDGEALLVGELENDVDGALLSLAQPEKA